MKERYTKMKIEVNDEIKVNTYPKEMKEFLILAIEEAKKFDNTIIVKEHNSDLFRFSIEVYDREDFLYEKWFTYKGEIIWK